MICILCLTVVPVQGRMTLWREELENYLIAETDLLKYKIQRKGELTREDYQEYQSIFDNLAGDYEFGIVIARRYVMPADDALLMGEAVETPADDVLLMEKPMETELRFSIQIQEGGEKDELLTAEPEAPALKLIYKKEIMEELKINGKIVLGNENFFNIFVEKCNVLSRKSVIIYRGLWKEDYFYYTTGGETR